MSGVTLRDEMRVEGLDEKLVEQLVEQAPAGGLQLTGENGVLQQLTKRLLESALEGEITDHLGYEKHDPAGRNGGNSRNGHRKAVLTDVSPVDVTVPRGRDGSFEPHIVATRQRWGVRSGRDGDFAVREGVDYRRNPVPSRGGVRRRPRRPRKSGSRSAPRRGGKYPAIVRLWRNAWAEFVPFLAFSPEIRRVICSTNAVESVNARIRRAVNAHGRFPNEAAALKCVYLAVRSLDPTGTGRRRWMIRWKPVLNAFEIAFEGPLPAGRS